MVVQMSCDHHEPNRGIPDNRSRKRMLAQLRAAADLSDALARVFTEGRVRYRQQGDQPALVADLAVIAPLMQTWLAWLQVAPRDDDDWTPPFPPAEITVPTYQEDETPTAADTSQDTSSTSPDLGET